MTRSQDCFAAAQRHIPGGVNSPVRAFRAVGGTPVFFARAEGPRLYDVEGNGYLVYVQSNLARVSSLLPSFGRRCLRRNGFFGLS